MNKIVTKSAGDGARAAREVKVFWLESCKCWAARVRLGHGRRVQKNFPNAGSEEEARAMAGLWYGSLTADGRVASMLFADAFAEWLENRAALGAAPNTVRHLGWVASHVNPRLGSSNVAELEPLDFTRLMRLLVEPKGEGGDGLATKSAAAVYNALRGFYADLINAGLCKTNPLLYVKRPPDDRHHGRALDEREYRLVDAALPAIISDPSRPWRDRTCAFGAWMALSAGLRSGEVCALRIRDISFVRGDVSVGGDMQEPRGAPPYRRERTKGGSDRLATIDGRDLEFVKLYMRARKAELGTADGWLVTADGEPMRPQRLSHWFHELADRLGIPTHPADPDGVTFHSLRHSRATWSLAAGADLNTVSETLGHADVMTTARFYVHPSLDSHKREADGYRRIRDKISEGGQ